MFSNRISTRDLLSGSQNTQDRGGGYGDTTKDISQLQNAQFTQFEMSQQYSQDFYSQSDQYSGGSNSESQGRGVPAYEKYMSKPSLFRTNSQNRIPANRSTNQGVPQISQTRAPAASGYQQQVISQKVKAKERDERDMLSSIVTFVKECSDEVKQNLSSLREADHETGDALQLSIKTVGSSVEDYSNKILKAIHIREEHNEHIAALQAEIRQKDDKIQDLIKQKSDCNKTDNAKSILDAMKTFLSDQQSHTQQKLQRILESTQEQLVLTKDVDSCQRSGVEENNKHYLDVKYMSQRNIQDTEKRLLSELTNLRDDFERQKRDMENFYRSQIQNLQQKNVRDLEQQIQLGIDNSVKETKQSIETYYKDNRAELKAICRSQQREMEKFIKTNNSDQSKDLLKQNQEFINKQQKDMQKDLHKKLDGLKRHQDTIMEESKKCLEEVKTTAAVVNERPWQNEYVPKSVQEQLDNLHNHHQSEIKRLETEIQNQIKVGKNTEEVNATDNNSTRNSVADSSLQLQNIYDFQSEETNKAVAKRRGKLSGPLFMNSSGFKSPRPLKESLWNSRSIFGRINPSPIATVLPQRNIGTDMNYKENSLDESESNEQTIPRQLRSRARNTDAMTVPTDLNFPQSLSQDTLHMTENRLKTQQFTTRTTKRNEGSQIMRNRDDEDKRNVKQKKPGKRKGRKRKQGVKSLNSNKTQSRILNENQVSRKNKYSDASSIAQTLQTDTVIQEKNVLSKPHIFSSPTIPKSGDGLSSGVFDFHDEMSPGPILRKQRNNSSLRNTSSRESLSDRSWTAVTSPHTSVSSSDEGSHNSSPSLSVTEVFIRRKVMCADGMHPDKKKTFTETRTAVAPSDFLSTPNLTEMYKDENVKCISTISGNEETQQGYKSKRRLGEKRKLCDFDTQVIHMMQCSQRRRSKYSA